MPRALFIFTVIPFPTILVVIDIAIEINRSFRMQNHRGKRLNYDVRWGLNYNGRPDYDCRWKRF
ncbi:MAG: hypothetical protein IBX72_04345 [Nitrospirae bacterium]|nr:hypothetical protein [Nitrospirota bacterium]